MPRGHPGWGGCDWWSSGDLQWGLQHLHEEGVDGGVPNELEEEEVLQAFQADGAQSWETQQQLGKPAGEPRAWVTREWHTEAPAKGDGCLAFSINM